MSVPPGMVPIPPDVEAPPPSPWRRFFLPRLTRRYVLRVIFLAIGAVILFKFLIQPAWVHGSSMEPTYHNGRLIFVWQGRYWFSEPKVGDVVMIRFSGKKVMLFKRIVGLAGDTIAFHEGVLMRNGEPVDEPYVEFREDWQLPERLVEPGKVYVVGDNRGMKIEEHKFGQVAAKRIIGGPLW